MKAKTIESSKEVSEAADHYYLNPCKRLTGEFNQYFAEYEPIAEGTFGQVGPVRITAAGLNVLVRPGKI